MKYRFKLGMLSYVHLLVDFSCAFWVGHMILYEGEKAVNPTICYSSYAAVPNYNEISWLLLYNFCAFALQLPLGMLADRYWQKRSWRIAALGVCLIGVAGIIAFQTRGSEYYTQAEILSAVLLLGHGNALYHVGAGVRVLQMERGMTPVGIFISTGALGIFGGGFLCRYLEGLHYFKDYREVLSLFSAVIIFLSFAAAGLLLLGAKMDALQKGINQAGQAEKQNAFSHVSLWDSLPQEASWSPGIIVLLFLVVVLRSFQGTYVSFSWNDGSDLRIALLLVLCVAAGKALGGILADRFGLSGVLIPLFLSVLLFLGSEKMLSGLLALLLFQTTMPVTLFLMHRQLPGLPGTAFGLLSFGLFLGYLPKLCLQCAMMDSTYFQTACMKWFVDFGNTSVMGLWFRSDKTRIYCIVTAVSFLLLLCALLLWKRESASSKVKNPERKER